MRILYIDHTAQLGGGEIALANLVRHIDRTIVDPSVVLFEPGPLFNRLRAICDTHLLRLDSSVGKADKNSLGWSSVLQLKAAWLSILHVAKVARLAKRLHVDLIHTNSLKADLIGGLAGRLVGIPVVWHVRDRIDADYLPSPIVKLFRTLSRVIPAYVIANSEATLATLNLSSLRRAKAIGSGIDLGHESLRDTKDDISFSSRPGVLIALVGRISPWKGQHIFIKAAAQVLLAYPAAQFQIIGASLFAEREYEESLHDLCRVLQIESSIAFLGFVDDVPTKVAGIDILVHASTTGEPFGQVIIEGMAAAKPVVATNGGGVPEIVEDGLTGILVPMGDVDAMAQAIQYLLGHPELMVHMGHLGRERVLQRFTIQQTARLVEGVYRDVLQ